MMARFRGQGYGTGLALGTAAIVREDRGALLPPKMPERIAKQVAERRLTETPEIVLIADRLLAAVSIAANLAWGRVVAIVVEADEPALAGPTPIVTGLPGLMAASEDDLLVLVDAIHGVVLIDPDAVYLGQYTAEHDRIAPKQRLYLDSAHLPAVTVDGRTLSTGAVVAADKVGAALDAGADTLYADLPLLFDANDVQRALAPFIEAGKPIYLDYTAFLPIAPILELAARADITLALPLEEDGSLSIPSERLLAEVARLSEEMATNDVITGDVRLAAPLDVAQCTGMDEKHLVDLIDTLASAGVTRLLAGRCDTSREAYSTLAALTAAAAKNLIPVIRHDATAAAALEDGASDALVLQIERSLGAGVSGFLGSAESVALCKTVVSASSVSDCREALTAWLNGPAAQEIELLD